MSLSNEILALIKDAEEIDPYDDNNWTMVKNTPCPKCNQPALWSHSNFSCDKVEYICICCEIEFSQNTKKFA